MLTHVVISLDSELMEEIKAYVKAESIREKEKLNVSAFFRRGARAIMHSATNEYEIED